MRTEKLCVPRALSAVSVCQGAQAPAMRTGAQTKVAGGAATATPADRLDQMLRVNEQLQKYNEIVLDVQALVKQWPVGIEAVVFIKDSLNWPPSVASDVHRRLLVEYGAEAATIPLLQLTLTGGGAESPFSVPNRSPP